MRLLISVLCFFLLIPTSALLQSTGHSKPAGIAAGDTLANQQLEPPMKTGGPRQINIDQVNSETQELRKLADGLPAEMDQVTKGQLPKDLGDNLKRIEKLAKHLHGEVIP
jgi:hypothetical protein